uniref:CWF19-like protein 1 n=1 Tax=Panagrolaimus sp. PS1159 TaxID=55785 RepID=A0AC35G1K3_9BILA
MSAKPIKLLCVGDVNGRFQELLKRIKLVSQKSGNFDILLCVGEFFGPDAALNKKVASGEIQFPIPTYVLGPCCPSTSQFYPDENAEFSPNLTYLGRKGILNTAQGLTIAYVSGIEAVNIDGEAKLFEFNEKTIDDLLLPVRAKSGFLGVDILLTAVWPAEVSKYSSNTPSTDIEGSKLISRLATGLKPRYHFSGIGCHYERTPYRNHRVLVEAAQHTTRFIGLASVGNPNKEKWMYAVSIVPMRKLTRDELTQQPPNASEFPYMEILQEYLQKRREAEMKKPENQFFFDMNADPGQEDSIDRGGRKRRGGGDFNEGERPPKQNIAANHCWFCLSNVGTEKHLIVSIGTKTYAAMPKGPLTDDHVMIMSINHVQSLTAADDELRAEVAKYRDAFSLMADAAGKVLVAFERNYKCSHLMINLIPVPKAKSKGLRLQFLSDAQDKGIEMEIMEKDKQVWDILFEGQPYFYVELPDGSRLLTKQMKNFPLQFGREILAGKELLDCEDKADWKNCKLSEEEEATLANQMKQKFKPYDFAADSSDSDDD